MTCQSHESSSESSSKSSETPILSGLKIAAPCSADWETMIGTERERFCGSCSLNVYNISSMATLEAEKFLADRAGSRVCVQFYRRKDGTILNDNCPKGLRAIRDRGRKLLKIASSVVALISSTVFGTIFGASANEPNFTNSGQTLRGRPAIEQPLMGEPTRDQPLMGKPSMPAVVDPKALQAQLQKKITELKARHQSSETSKIELARTHNDLAQSYSGCSNFKKADEQFSEAGKLLKKIKSQKPLYANVLLNQAAALRQDNRAKEAKTLEVEAAKLTN